MKQQLAFRYAYAAGVIDSDGCILIAKASDTNLRRRFSKVNPSYRLMVTVNLSDGRVLDVLYGWFGGRVYASKSMRTLPIRYEDGRIYGGYGRQMYRWEITQAKAKDFLKKLLPFLVYKKLQAEVGIAFYTHYEGYNQPMKFGRYLPTEVQEVQLRESYYLKLRELKQQFRPSRAAAETKRADSSDFGREAIVHATAN